MPVTVYDLNYPGDPPSTVIEMSQEEFLATHPNRMFSIGSLNWETGEVENKETLPVGDEVLCDLCNESIDPGELLYLWQYGRGGEKAICEECFQRGFARYCTKKGEQ